MVDKHQNTVYSIYIADLIFKEIERQPLSAEEQSELDQWRKSHGHRNEFYEQLQDRSGRIVLDSAGNGQLALQGNAMVVKKNDQLTYKAVGEGGAVVYNTMATQCKYIPNPEYAGKDPRLKF